MANPYKNEGQEERARSGIWMRGQTMLIVAVCVGLA